MSDQQAELEEFRALDEKRQFEPLSEEEEARYQELLFLLGDAAAATQVKRAPEPIELDLDLSASPDEPVALASNAEFVRAEGSSEDDRGVSVDEVPAVELEVESGDLNSLTGSWQPEEGEAPVEAPPAIELDMADSDEPVQLASGAEFLDNPELVNSGEQGWKREEPAEGEGAEGEAPSDENKTMFSLGPADDEEVEVEMELESSTGDENKTMFSLGPADDASDEVEVDMGESEAALEVPAPDATSVGEAPSADDDNKTMFSLGPADDASDEVEVDMGESEAALEAPAPDATSVGEAPSADDDNKTMFSLGPVEDEEAEAELEAEAEVEVEVEAEAEPMADAELSSEPSVEFSPEPEFAAAPADETSVTAAPADEDDNKTMFSLGPVEEEEAEPELEAEPPAEAAPEPLAELEPLPEPEPVAMDATAVGAFPSLDGTALLPVPADESLAEALPALDGLDTDLPPLDAPFEAGLDAGLSDPIPLESLAESLPPMEPVPAAPAAELSPGSLVGDHPVVLQLLDGTVKRGALRDPNLTAESVAMVDANGVEESLYTADMKLIVFLVRPGEGRPELRGEYCTVTFMDGRQLGGFTDEDIENAELGFSLLPPSPQTDAARLYVFRNGLSGVARG
jgi:hypothetical protein